MSGWESLDEPSRAETTTGSGWGEHLHSSTSYQQSSTFPYSNPPSPSNHPIQRDFVHSSARNTSDNVKQGGHEMSTGWKGILSPSTERAASSSPRVESFNKSGDPSGWGALTPSSNHNPARTDVGPSTRSNIERDTTGVSAGYMSQIPPFSNGRTMSIAGRASMGQANSVSLCRNTVEFAVSAEYELKLTVASWYICLNFSVTRPYPSRRRQWRSTSNIHINPSSSS